MGNDLTILFYLVFQIRNFISIFFYDFTQNNELFY